MKTIISALLALIMCALFTTVTFGQYDVKKYDPSSVSGRKFLFVQHDQSYEKTYTSATLKLINSGIYPTAESSEFQKLCQAMDVAFNRDAFRTGKTTCTLDSSKTILGVKWEVANHGFPMEKSMKVVGDFFGGTAMYFYPPGGIDEPLAYKSLWAIYPAGKSLKLTYNSYITSRLMNAYMVSLFEYKDKAGNDSLLIEVRFLGMRGNSSGVSKEELTIVMRKNGVPELVSAKWFLPNNCDCSLDKPVEPREWFYPHYGAYIGDLPANIQRYFTPAIKQAVKDEQVRQLAEFEKIR